MKHIKQLILFLLIIGIAAVASAQKQDTKGYTDQQLDALQCQARVIDRDVTIEKQGRQIQALQKELDELKKQ